MLQGIWAFIRYWWPVAFLTGVVIDLATRTLWVGPALSAVFLFLIAWLWAKWKIDGLPKVE